MATLSHAVAAVYRSPAETELALEELQFSGFNMKSLSIIGRDYHTDEDILEEQTRYWGKMGSFYDEVWGLFGFAFILIPGVGPLFVAGPLVARVVGGLEGVMVAGGLSVLGADLYNLGFPKGSLLAARNSGKFVVIAHGNKEEAIRARDIVMGHAKREALQKHQNSPTRREPSLAGAVIMGMGGLNTIGAGLYSLGIPKDNLLRYEAALTSGKFVVIAHGNGEETSRAQQAISRTNPEMLQQHHPLKATL
jgi:hypothetical protein